MISVCMITYNGEKYILEQIYSILSQLSEEDELIISDDNSSDLTVSVISSIDDKRIKIYSHKAEINRYSGIWKKIFTINRNANNALIHAKGDYIFLADQDDIWEKDKVNVIMNQLSNGIDCVVHDCKIVNNNLETISNSFFEFIRPHSTVLGTLYKSSFMGCCMAFNKKVLERSIPFPSLPIEHDTWIGLCAFKTGKVKIINDKLLLYRRHGNNVSFCGEKSKNSIWVKFLRRFYMLYCYLFY